MTLREVIAARKERDPTYREPGPEEIEAMQAQIDEAIERMSPEKARQLARIWLPHLTEEHPT